MAKLPSFQFYPGDWMKDTALRRCSIEERGLWIDILCMMFDCEERGVLITGDRPITEDELAHMLKHGVALRGRANRTKSDAKLDRNRHETVIKAIRNLVGFGVMKVRESDGAFYSSRMVNEEKQRVSDRLRQRRHRRVTDDVTDDVTPLSQRSSSSSSSSSTPNGVDPPIAPPSVATKKKSIKVRELPEDFPLPDEIDTPLGRKYLAQWISYKTERNQSYTEAGLMALIAKWAPLGERALVAAVRDSMASNYAGLFENKQNGVATQVRRKGNLDLDRILRELENEEK